MRAVRPSLIVSDVHLGVEQATEAAFAEFLHHTAAHAAELLIAGDLFDVFFAFENYTPPRHRPTLARLRDVVGAGVRVRFVGGNRDANEWSGGALRRHGVEVLPDPARLDFAGRRTLVTHGDGVRPGRAEYRKGQRLLRHPAVVWAAGRLVPRDWLFDRLSENSGARAWAARHARGLSTGPKARAEGIEAWALKALAADPTLALVVSGHSHLPALRECAPGRYYVNAGDWISHFTYVELPADGRAPEVRCWPSRALLDWGTVDDGSERTRPPSGVQEEAGEGGEHPGPSRPGHHPAP